MPNRVGMACRYVHRERICTETYSTVAEVTRPIRRKRQMGVLRKSLSHRISLKRSETKR
jgi:hypothetical protein